MSFNEILYNLHSGFRWIVVIAAVLALVINLYALFTKRAADDKLVKNGMRFWTISLDIQWLIGIILILVLGLFTRPELEHAFANTLAVVVAHSAVAFRKRSDQSRLIANLATIAIALLIVIVAVSVVNGWS